MCGGAGVRFAAAFKTEGSQWGRIAEKLPGRTAGQVAALGKQHRALLASHGATADMLCDAVQDHYAKQAAARESAVPWPGRGGGAVEVGAWMQWTLEPQPADRRRVRPVRLPNPSRHSQVP